MINVEVAPAILPHKNRRHGASFSGDVIIAARNCSYAKKLIPAYGNTRTKLAEWPLKSASIPYEVRMCLAA